MVTAQKKNTTENTTKSIGRCNHPSTRIIPRKAISIGMVTSRSVIITSFVLGSFLGLGMELEIDEELEKEEECSASCTAGETASAAA